MFHNGYFVQTPEPGRFWKPPRRSEENEEIQCRDCFIWIKGYTQYQAHISGSKHSRRVTENANAKIVEAMPFITKDEKSAVYKCTICNLSFNSCSVVVMHLNGARHREIEKNGQPSENQGGDKAKEGQDGSAKVADQDGAANQSEGLNENAKEGASSQNVKSEPPRPPVPNKSPALPALSKSFLSKFGVSNHSAPVPTNTATYGKFPCLACGIMTNSQTQLDQHLGSIKHKNRLLDETPPAPPVQLSVLECKKCNVLVNSQIQLDQHLSSAKHKNKIQTRVAPYPQPARNFWVHLQNRRMNNGNNYSGNDYYSGNNYNGQNYNGPHYNNGHHYNSGHHYSGNYYNSR